jgi:hypothetical protein
MPSIIAIIDLLPEVDRESVVKASLEWSLALRPCATLVVSKLLYILFIVATRGWVALVVLAAVVPLAPGASFGGAAGQCGFSMALRPRGRILSRILQPLYLRVGWKSLG